MICKACGCERDAKSRFCDQCGADAVGTKTEKQDNIIKTEAKDERMPEHPIHKLVDGMIEQVLAMITVVAGAAAGNPTATGAGLLAGSKQSSYTKFAKVKQVVVHPKRQVIYLNESMQHNQVYAASEDFDAVRDYILSQTPKANIKYKR